MQVHLVGGFLGSGKTVAIAAACRALAARKLTAAVITNDQGKYPVDTAYFDSQKIPAVQVTGGCLCTQYDELLSRLDQLERAIQPDVVFAEVVGSAADVVATIVKPLREVERTARVTFSVFADTRLFSQWISGEPLPFSPKVMYVYGGQLAEAGLLVLNKRDLVSPERAHSALDDARARFPAKQVRLQNSLDPLQIDGWLSDLDNLIKHPLPLNSLQIDYTRYAAGISSLGWLDTHINFTAPAILDYRPLVIDWITGLDREFRQRAIGLGHFKVMLKAGKTEARVSLTTGDAAGWRAQIPALRCRDLYTLVNARVEGGAEHAREVVIQTATSAAGKISCSVEEKDVEAFHPAFPKPKRRVA